MSRQSAKYQSLGRYLEAQSGDQVTLTFAQIEAILGASLPPSAGARWWWNNDRQAPQARAWVGAGWRVVRPETWFVQVTFVRQEGQP